MFIHALSRMIWLVEYFDSARTLLQNRDLVKQTKKLKSVSQGHPAGSTTTWIENRQQGGFRVTRETLFSFF